MSQHAVTHAPAPLEPPARHGEGEHREQREHGEVEIGALAPHFEPVAFPGKQVAGFAGSVALTVLALLAVMHHLLPPAALLVTVIALAALQAVVQLGSFMHLREAGGEAWQIPVLALAFVIAVGIVGFSFWIMTFKWGVS